MERYDYVIVGAGSAGCAVAARLSEDPARACCCSRPAVATGIPTSRSRPRSPSSSRPSSTGTWPPSPSPRCDHRSLYVPRGKSLGGSSSMNAMLYVRGAAARLRRLARRAGLRGLGLGGRVAGLQALGGQLARPVGVPRRRRPAVGQRPASPRPLTERFLNAAANAGIAARGGLQRRRERGPAGSRSRSATAGAGAPPTPSCAGAEAREPDRRHRRACAPGSTCATAARAACCSAPAVTH